MNLNPPDPLPLAFQQANELWFWDGRTHQALRLYEQAAAAAPDDVAVQYQWARAQWALGRADAALATLEQALARAGPAHPSPAQATQATLPLRQLKQQLGEVAPGPLPTPLQPEDLDVDRLSGVQLSAADWRAVVRAALQRAAWGVAIFAHERSKGAYTDFDEEKEGWKLVRQAEGDLSLLDLMNEPDA